MLTFWGVKIWLFGLSYKFPVVLKLPQKLWLWLCCFRCSDIAVEDCTTENSWLDGREFHISSKSATCWRDGFQCFGSFKSAELKIFNSPLEPLSTESLIQKHQHWKLSQHKTSVLEGEKFNISDLEEAGHFPLILMGNENVGCSRFIGVEMLSLHELRWETRVSERKCEENLRKLSQYLKISVNGMDGWEWVWMVGIR